MLIKTLWVVLFGDSVLVALAQGQGGDSNENLNGNFPLRDVDLSNWEIPADFDFHLEDVDMEEVANANNATQDANTPIQDDVTNTDAPVMVVPERVRIGSWHELMEVDANTEIEIDLNQIFRYSYRVCRLTEGSDLQLTEPFVLALAAENEGPIITGRAEDVREDPNLVLVHHLRARDLREYVRDHRNVRGNEPRNHFHSVRERNLASGYMSFNQLRPILTGTQWQQRARTAILEAIVRLDDYLFENLESINDPNDILIDLNKIDREFLGSFEYRMNVLNRNLKKELTYRNRKFKRGGNKNTDFCTHITPYEWRRWLLPTFTANGGKKTNHKAEHDTWEVDGLEEEEASEILCSGNGLLRRVDDDGWVWAIDNVKITYSVWAGLLSVVFGMIYGIPQKKVKKNGETLTDEDYDWYDDKTKGNDTNNTNNSNDSNNTNNTNNTNNSNSNNTNIRKNGNDTNNNNNNNNNDDTNSANNRRNSNRNSKKNASNEYYWHKKR